MPQGRRWTRVPGARSVDVRASCLLLLLLLLLLRRQARAAAGRHARRRSSDGAHLRRAAPRRRSPPPTPPPIPPRETLWVQASAGRCAHLDHRYERGDLPRVGHAALQRAERLHPAGRPGRGARAARQQRPRQQRHRRQPGQRTGAHRPRAVGWSRPPAALCCCRGARRSSAPGSQARQRMQFMQKPTGSRLLRRGAALPSNPPSRALGHAGPPAAASVKP